MHDVVEVLFCALDLWSARRLRGKIETYSSVERAAPGVLVSTETRHCIWVWIVASAV